MNACRHSSIVPVGIEFKQSTPMSAQSSVSRKLIDAGEEIQKET